MGSSPDVGGSRGMGRPPTLDYREMEQTSTVELNKQQLGQVKNTLDVPFTLLGGNAWKYQAHACKPTLTQTVFEAMVRNDIRDPNALSEKQFKELKDKLPVNLKMGLERSLKMSYEERDPAFIVLENLLRFFAKLLARFEIIEQVEVHEEKRSHFQNLASSSLRRWTEDAVDILDILKEKNQKNSVVILSRLINFSRALLSSSGETRDSLITNLKKELGDLLMKVKEGLAPHVLQITLHLMTTLQEIVLSLGMENSSLYYLIAKEEILSPISLEFLNKLLKRDLSLGESDLFFLPKLVGLALLLSLFITLHASGIKRQEREEDERFESEAIQSLALKLAAALTAHSTLLREGATRLIQLLPLKREPLITNGALLAALLELPITANGEEKEIKNSLSPLFGYSEEIKQTVAHIRTKGGPPLRSIEKAAEERSILGLTEAVKRVCEEEEIDYDSLIKESFLKLQSVFGMLEAHEEAKQQEGLMNVIKQSA